MSWSSVLLTACLAIVMGFVGGALVLVRGRRSSISVAAEAPEASFELTHVDGQTWMLTNVGSAEARAVVVVPHADGVEQWPPVPTPGSVTTATSQRLPTLVPGEAMNVWLSRHDRGQQLLVGWTSDRNVRMGPVVLDVPAP